MLQHRRIIAWALAGAVLAPVGLLAESASASPIAIERAAIGDDSIATQAQAALDKRGASGYPAALDAVAQAVADRLWIDAAKLKAAFAKADAEHQTALLAALAQTGVPYRRNAQNPGAGFDCSGLTRHAWSVAGFSLPRISRSQISSGAARTRATAQAGDLVYYPGHVMIWLGVDNAIVHSPFTGRDVQVDFISKRRADSVRFADPTG